MSSRINKMVYITGFHPETTAHDLKVFLGEVGRVRLMQKASRHAFAEFRTREEADQVVEELNGVELFGCALSIEFAHLRNIDINNCLRIRNLTVNITLFQILKLLEETGEPVEMRRVTDKEAMVEFFYHEDAEYALEHLNGRMLTDSRILLIRESDLLDQDPQVSSSSDDDVPNMPTPIPHMDYSDDDEQQEPDSTC